jgi:hypothetical protein
LNLTQDANPLPKFKDQLPKFSGNDTISTKEHIIAFSNACHNIGETDNDICMCLFVNSLEGKVAVVFCELHPNVILTWDELNYWLKSTYGKLKKPTNLLKEYNNIVYNNGEAIKYFNLIFTKLYNQIPELILLHNQANFIQYYNAFPSSYSQRLEEKNVNNLGSVL